MIDFGSVLFEVIGIKEPRTAKKRLLTTKGAYVEWLAAAVGAAEPATMVGSSRSLPPEEEELIPWDDDTTVSTLPMVDLTEAPKQATIISAPLWPESLPTEERSFIIHVKMLPKLQTIAREHRIGLEVVPLSPRALAREAWRKSTTAQIGDDHHMPAMFMYTGERLAKDYVRINLSYPKGSNEIIGTAEYIGDDGKGNPLVKLKGDGYWTQSRVRALDFTRCDRCGVHHARKYVYVVEQGDGTVMQVGGQCADHMNLGKHLRMVLKGIEELIKTIQEDRDDDYVGSLFGSGAAGWDLIGYLILLDQYLMYRPYVSGKAHYEKYGFAGGTAHDVAGLLDAVSRTKRTRDENGEITAGAVVADARRAYEGSPRLRWLQDVIANELKSKQADEADGMHAANMALAVATGRMPGYIAAAIYRATRGSDNIKAWLASAPILGFATTHSLFDEAASSADFATVRKLAESMGLTLDQLAAELEIPEAKLEKAKEKGKDFPYPFEKLRKLLPGLWVVVDHFSFSGDYGVSYRARLVRLSDRRYLSMTGSGAAGLNRGDVVRIWKFSEGKDDKGYQDRSGYRWPPTQQINRAEVEKVDGVTVPSLTDAPAAPKVPAAKEFWT